MPITGQPTFSARDIPTATQLNTWMATITAKFVSLVSTPDIQWPLNAGGDIDLSGYTLTGLPKIQYRRSLSSRRPWQSVEQVLAEIEAFGGGVGYIDAATTITPSAVDGSGKTVGFVVGNGTTIEGAGASSVMEGVRAEGKSNLTFRNMKFTGVVRIEDCDDVRFDNCIFGNSAAYALDVRNSRNVRTEGCQFGVTTEAVDVLYFNSGVTHVNNTHNENNMYVYVTPESNGSIVVQGNRFDNPAAVGKLVIAGVNKADFETSSIVTYAEVDADRIVVKWNIFYSHTQLTCKSLAKFRAHGNIFNGTNTQTTTIVVWDGEHGWSTYDSPNWKERGIILSSNIIGDTQPDNGMVLGSVTNRRVVNQGKVRANVLKAADVALQVQFPNDRLTPTNTFGNGTDQYAGMSIIGNVIIGADVTEAAFEMICRNAQPMGSIIAGNMCANGSTLGAVTRVSVGGAVNAAIGNSTTAPASGAPEVAVVLGNEAQGLLVTSTNSTCDFRYTANANPVMNGTTHLNNI